MDETGHLIVESDTFKRSKIQKSQPQKPDTEPYQCHPV